jgi:small subunit ribosomal protein S16
MFATVPRMLTIRLQRRGRKNDPSFRVIVVDSKQGPKSGKFIDLVGSYDPRTDRIDLQAERIQNWMKNGAQVSDTVHNLLVTKGVIEGKKRNVLPRKSPPKKEEEEVAAAAAPVAAPEVKSEEVAEAAEASTEASA